MKYFPLTFIAILFLIASSFAQICDATRSYNKTWTLQAREREENREERQKHYKSLTPEQRAQISDIEIYPTHLMTCGMGFSNGLAKIFVNEKAGFINKKGKVVIKPKFKDVGRFSENLAPFESENGKWGYINKQGEVVIKPVFDWALIFRGGLALIQIGEKWGFINATGEIIIKPQFDHANSFSEGLAHVKIYREKYYSGYIDKKGDWAIQPVFDGGDDFVNGKAIIDENVKDDKGQYKYTESFLIDKSGKKLKEVDWTRNAITHKLLDSDEITMFFEDYKTGYKYKTGKIIWKPTK